MSAFTLKLIAMAAMVVDHVGLLFFPEATFLRYIGRLAFPLFCFLVAEGCAHTKNKKRYLLRLLVLALVSEVPFNLFLSGRPYYPGAQNTVFTLWLGLFSLCLFDWAYPKSKALALLWPVAGCVLAVLLRTDYGWYGVAMIFLFYALRHKKSDRLSAVGGLICLYALIGRLRTFFALLSLPLLGVYNGKRGPSLKYLFYVFYPVHLALLYWLHLVL